MEQKILETIPNIDRRHLKILGVLSPTEGREELNEDCYERYRKYWTKWLQNVDGDINVGIGNNKVINTVRNNVNAALNNKGKFIQT